MEQTPSNPLPVPLSQTGPLQVPPSYTFPSAGVQAPMVYTLPQKYQRNKYQHKCVHGLSVSLIVLGCLCFLVQLIEIFVMRITGESGVGIWSGVIFIVTGAVGIFSSKKRTTCAIVVFLVMSSVGAVISIAPLTAGAIGWSIGENDHYIRYYYYKTYGSRLFGYGDGTSFEHRRIASVNLNSIMMFAGIANGILMIISAAYACHGLRRDRSSRRTLLVPGLVQYVPGANGQQQMIILPIPQTVPEAPHIQTSSNPTVTTVMPGQQVVITNPTSADQITASGGVPQLSTYDHQAAPPQYQEKEPVLY